MTEPLLEPSSVTVVPDMYARKAGIIGRMHGATNEPRPASNATSIVGAAMWSVFHLTIKSILQVRPNLLDCFHYDSITKRLG